RGRAASVRDAGRPVMHSIRRAANSRSPAWRRTGGLRTLRALLLDLFHVHPPALARGREHGVHHIVGREAVAEVRTRGLAGVEALEEVRDLMDEAVLVADLQAGHPPVLHVGLVA